MKQGSADDPFAEDSTDEPGSQQDSKDRRDEDVRESQDSSSETKKSAGTNDHNTVQTHSLPYIHSRDGVKDGRTQRPIFLREHVEAGIDDLVDKMEDEFGETVYKTDITEAAMVIAQENPDLLRSTLEEWGYGWS